MVFRVEKTKGYTVMSNYHLRDKNLSLKAKGLLSVILSLPEDWEYSIKGLSEICKESINTVMRILQELESLYYLERERIFGERGRIKGFSYVFYESPYRQNEDMVNPYLHSPYLQNADMVNEDGNKLLNNVITKELNINKINKDVVASDTPREEAPAEQQQQPEDFIFVGVDKNVRVRKSFYETFKNTYSYHELVLNALSEYKQKNGITAHITDEKYLSEWAESDREKYEFLVSKRSFNTDDFFNAALLRSYGNNKKYNNGG